MVNPFAAARPGTFSADGVRVRRRTGPHRNEACGSDLCTSRFCTTRAGHFLDVAHDIAPDELSDDLAVLLADQLDDAGVLRGQPEFELVFTGVIRSTVDGIMPAWLRFYRNSLVQARARDGRLRSRPRTCGVAAPRHPLRRPRVLLRLLPTEGSQSWIHSTGNGSERADDAAALPRQQ